jgi:hypothetical protein
MRTGRLLRPLAHSLVVALVAGVLSSVAALAVTAAPAAAECSNSGVSVTVNGAHTAVTGCNDGTTSTGSNLNFSGQGLPAGAIGACRREFGDQIWGFVYPGPDYSHCGVRPGWEPQAMALCVVRHRVVMDGVTIPVAEAPQPWVVDNIPQSCLAFSQLDMNDAVPCGAVNVAVIPQLSYFNAPDDFVSGSPLFVSRPDGTVGCGGDDPPVIIGRPVNPRRGGGGGVARSSGQVQVTITGPAYPVVGGELRPARFSATTGAFQCVGCIQGGPAPALISLNYRLDLAGVGGYQEGPNADFSERDPSPSGSCPSARLGGNAFNGQVRTFDETCGLFYHATSDAERVRPDVVGASGIYRVWLRQRLAIANGDGTYSYVTTWRPEDRPVTVNVVQLADGSSTPLSDPARKVIAATNTPRG